MACDNAGKRRKPDPKPGLTIVLNRSS